MVAGTFDSGLALWRLATTGDCIVGCMALVKYPWNRSSEISRRIIHSEFQRGKNGIQFIDSSIFIN